MSLWAKKEMDLMAAKQFWKWFEENEQWMIENIKTNGMDVVLSLIHISPMKQQRKLFLWNLETTRWSAHFP